MSEGFLSAITMSSPLIDESELYVDPTRPSDTTSVRVSLTTTKDPALECEGAVRLMTVMVRVEVHVTQDTEDGDVPLEKMHARVKLVGTVSANTREGLSEDDMRTVLRTNAVSLLYSSARSYIEFLTSQSSMGRYTIPPIDPVAYIESLDSVDDK